MQARLLNHSYQQDLRKLMKNIGVDAYGIRLMQPKASLRVIYLTGVSSFSANILKQETLSLGADLALPRQAILKNRLIDCILLATDSQIEKLLKKLKAQPYSLKEIGHLISKSLGNFQCQTFSISTPKHNLKLNRPLVMGILNMTPDSFSGDGILKLKNQYKDAKSLFVEKIEEMARDGMDLVDIGGESSRPGAKPVSIRDELKRVIPAIKFIRKRFSRIPISIDTYKPPVAKAALSEGACIVNDITALQNRAMAKIVAKNKVGVVLMHMKGRPRTMQRNPFYKDTLKEIYSFLHTAINRAIQSGVDQNRIIIDVGIGFGKRLKDNLELIKHLYEFKSLGKPILIGTSRKSFIGSVLKKKDPTERLAGTLATLAISVVNGAKILRVHDVAQARQAITVANTIMSL
jgi:dihydropteroate synthase